MKNRNVRIVTAFTVLMPVWIFYQLIILIFPLTYLILFISLFQLLEYPFTGRKQILKDFLSCWSLIFGIGYSKAIIWINEQRFTIEF